MHKTHIILPLCYLSRLGQASAGLLLCARVYSCSRNISDICKAGTEKTQRISLLVAPETSNQGIEYNR